MNAQHTKGPWSVFSQNYAFFVIAGRAPEVNDDYPWHDEPRVAVAKIFGPRQWDRLPVDAQANARLISAAPDMLEALERLRDVLRDGILNSDVKDIAAATQSMVAAIAKARGR